MPGIITASFPRIVGDTGLTRDSVDAGRTGAAQDFGSFLVQEEPPGAPGPLRAPDLPDASDVEDSPEDIEVLEEDHDEWFAADVVQPDDILQPYPSVSAETKDGAAQADPVDSERRAEGDPLEVAPLEAAPRGDIPPRGGDVLGAPATAAANHELGPLVTAIDRKDHARSVPKNMQSSGPITAFAADTAPDRAVPAWAAAPDGDVLPGTADPDSAEGSPEVPVLPLARGATKGDGAAGKGPAEGMVSVARIMADMGERVIMRPAGSAPLSELGRAVEGGDPDAIASAPSWENRHVMAAQTPSAGPALSMPITGQPPAPASQGMDADLAPMTQVSDLGPPSEPRLHPVPFTDLRAMMPAGGHGPHVVRQIVARMTEITTKAGERSIDLHLSPSELGRVRITLVPGEAGMTVNLMAERPDTLDLMRRHIDILGQNLRDLGYGATNFAFAREDRPDRAAPDLPKDHVADDPPAPPRAQSHIALGAQGALRAQTDRVDIRL